MHKVVKRVTFQISKVGRITRIGQGIEVDDAG